MTTSDLAKVQRALLSVSDKEGLAEFGRFLSDQGVTLISTGGTARSLREAGLEVTEVSEITGFPEIMDGRVKTLHPMVHGGLLARRDKANHIEAMAEHGIAGIDLLVVNLYPFRETLASGADRETCVENIDIGGPAMVRAAAKNHASVTVITAPADYGRVQDDMTAHEGATTMGLRRKLAAKAYAHTAAYDSAISSWMLAEESEAFPAEWSAAGALDAVLRYGENPHQQAAFYRYGAARPGVATAEQHQGKELSYNNLNDTDAAYELVAEFERPAVAIIKHANPCGVAEGESLAEAYEKALACDPTSAFGGIIAVNRPLDGDAAQKMTEIFTEVVIAPDVSEEAKAVFAAKKNLRLLESGGLPDPAEAGLAFKAISGGILVQNRDNGRIEEGALKVVTKRAPDAQELADMLFAFRVAKHVKSNAIVYVKDRATLGVGAGQMSRVDSSRIAAWKGRETFGEEALKGAVVASDAFFPFADGLLEAVKAGATAVIQPGGSMRDEEVIAAADEAGLAMVFTGMRHFRH